MSTILALVKLALSFADGLMSYLNKEQLIEVGKLANELTNLKQAQDEQKEADAIRERVRRGELNDPFVRP